MLGSVPIHDVSQPFEVLLSLSEVIFLKGVGVDILWPQIVALLVLGTVILA